MQLFCFVWNYFCWPNGAKTVKTDHVVSKNVNLLLKCCIKLIKHFAVVLIFDKRALLLWWYCLTIYYVINKVFAMNCCYFIKVKIPKEHYSGKQTPKITIQHPSRLHNKMSFDTACLWMFWDVLHHHFQMLSLKGRETSVSLMFVCEQIANSSKKQRNMQCLLSD